MHVNDSYSNMTVNTYLSIKQCSLKPLAICYIRGARYYYVRGGLIVLCLIS